MNTINKENQKLVRYHNIRVGFIEEDVESGETLTGVFNLLNGFDARVIRADKYTIVILDDGSKGIAKCCEGDNFSFKKGLRIAFNRALMKRLEAETKYLCKN